ncbi:MAG TPA: HEAT repeat domain-containing protein [Oligoflexia bacterium]|nr:HEAT repeat domain-containing protein [Oligoflexia bacterium]
MIRKFILGRSVDFALFLGGLVFAGFVAFSLMPALAEAQQGAASPAASPEEEAESDEPILTPSAEGKPQRTAQDEELEAGEEEGDEEAALEEEGISEETGAEEDDEFAPKPAPTEEVKIDPSMPLAELQRLPMNHDTLIEELLRRMSSPDERTRLESGIALRKTARLSDVPLLVTILKRGNNEDKQRFIIDALGWLQDRRAGDALRFEIQHGDSASQRAAVTALGELRFNWSVPVLVRTVRKAEDEELRKRAASALGVIGTTQAIYALRTSLASLEEFIGAKNAAFWALEKARGEIDDQLIDAKMPKGRRLQLYYKGTRYFFYHPAIRREASATKEGLRPWLLVCVHDSDMRAEDLFNICWRAGKKRQMAVLVPYFDNIRYPEYGNFNIWGKHRADERLLELVEHVGKHAQLTVREFYLFGYGTGGDFVQRFTMSYPLRIARSAFESDNFTMPDREMYFPRGLNRTPLAPNIDVNMYNFVKTDSIIVLRKNSPALRDAKNFYEAVSHLADIEGVRSRFGVRTVDVKFEIWNEAEKYLFAYD